MATPSASVALFILVLFCCHVGSHANYTQLVSHTCSNIKIPGGSGFFDNLGSALADALVNTAYHDYNYKTSHGGNRAPTAYVAAKCMPYINPDECHDCLQLITEGIWARCSNAIGGQERLVSCSLRYEQYHF